ncbi:hypothetical protein EVAR_53402_1 [Eumeta japonica]|uniref:Uncharacterized protein n=1 Tax=Eumeta variegata TaxID=151549 RepID=A0A4C1XQD2_EUMVA|nr:hypothetical protein EVAR_53402_1 [Eumeta japonica]
MIEKMLQSWLYTCNVQGGRDNLGTKDGLPPLLPCRRANIANCPCLPIHITIKVAIKGYPQFQTLDCPCGRSLTLEFASPAPLAGTHITGISLFVHDQSYEKDRSHQWTQAQVRKYRKLMITSCFKGLSSEQRRTRASVLLVIGLESALTEPRLCDPPDSKARPALVCGSFEL